MARKGGGDEDEGSSPEEDKLFEDAMRDVRPIERESVRVRRGPMRAERSARPVPAPESPLVVESAGERVTAFDPSLPPATRRALRQGATKPEATLDLHGVGAADVEARLERFIHESRTAGRRSVLVITGRGLRSGPDGPVLRERVVRALAEGPLARLVLAFVTASPASGGPGALLVLLRR
jgi:DNA-nicking Smr family endonuclease